MNRLGLPLLVLPVLVSTVYCGTQGNPPPSPPVSTAADGGPPIEVEKSTWTWVPVEGSECASGATAGIGINRAETDDELFIYLQGGGACWNQGTCVPSLLSYGPICSYGNVCLYDGPGGTQPAASHVREANPFPADGGGAFPGELAQVSSSRAFLRTDETNPFRNATYVFVPYCTGDLHAGKATRDYKYRYNLFDPDSTYTVHFSGATNMDRYLGRLYATFPNAKRIWLTGTSAGGYGATLNYERVKKAFPQAEVHLLADSSPFIDNTVHWPEWRDVWNLQLPADCTDCAELLSGLPSYLARTNPDRRFALLTPEQDPVIAYYFFGAPGLDAIFNPPLGPFVTELAQVETHYDALPNARVLRRPRAAARAVGQLRRRRRGRRDLRPDPEPRRRHRPQAVDRRLGRGRPGLDEREVTATPSRTGRRPRRRGATGLRRRRRSRR